MNPMQPPGAVVFVRIFPMLILKPMYKLAPLHFPVIPYVNFCSFVTLGILFIVLFLFMLLCYFSC